MTSNILRILIALAAVLATLPAAAQATFGRLSGLWWNPNEPGWAIHLAERDRVIFATLMTYSPSGAPRWVVASDCRLHGPGCNTALHEARNQPNHGVSSQGPGSSATSIVGHIDLAFTGYDKAQLTYQLDGVRRSVAITRQVFDAGPTNGDLMDFTGMYWNSLEPGWGLGVTHQGFTMFLTWFAYDASGSPVWYVAPDCGMGNAANVCSGKLYRASGPASAATFDPSQVRLTEVGVVSLDMGGNGGMLGYRVDGVNGFRPINPQLLP